MTDWMTAADPILAPARGTAEAVVAFLGRLGAATTETRAYVAEVYRLAPLVHIDPAVLIGQWAIENDYGRSALWTTRRNPAGIGVLGDPGGPVQDLGYSWADGASAARGQIVHMWQYTSPDYSLPNILFPYQTLDPRLDALRQSGWAGSVKVLRDLGGKWATQPTYGADIARRANEIFGWSAPANPAGGTPVSDPTNPPPTTDPPAPRPAPAPGALVFGLVPMPPIVWRVIPPAENMAWNDLGPRRIVGTCVHRMEGNLTGTDSYFRTFVDAQATGRGGLTDFGIGGALDGALDGTIYGWLALDTREAPWASGPADDLEGDGPAFIARFGVNAVNRDLRSIELSGQYETEVTDKQLVSLARLEAWIHDQAGVRWDSYPVNQAYGVVTSMQHWEFGPKPCPGSVLRGLTDRYQDMARGIMRSWQTQAQGTMTPTPPPAPVTPTVPYATAQDRAFLERRFGNLNDFRQNVAQPVVRPFDPAGVVSQAWAQRAFAEAAFPAPVALRRVDVEQGRTADEAIFANGWVLTFDSASPERGWRWAGKAA